MPYFYGIRVSVIPDPSVRLANLKAGKLDFIVLDAVQYKLVKSDPNFNVSTMPLNWLVYLTFNHSKGPCADIRVRQAISHAIDRNALVKGTQFGLGRVASCMYPDDHWAHNSDLKPVSYDPELSRKLLAQAGYINGLTLRGFTLNIPEAQAFAKAVMAMLEKVGITWKPVFLSVTGMMEPFRKLDFDVVGNLYPWIQEPDHIATLLYDPQSPFNNGRSHNEKAITLIKAGRETVDETKRAKIYFELEKALYENYEDAWLWWPTAVLAGGKNVLGFNVDMARQYGEGYLFSHPQWFKDGRP
jgi:peptide/nickel transport system substrate-binding protein